MKISAIKQQVKNPERASIFVDGKYGFSLSLDDLVREKLKHGQELDEAELKRLKKLSDDGKLKARALEWLLSRPRSVREFSDYLYRKKVEKPQIEVLVEEFTAKGYLSDEVFAKWLIEMRRRHGKSERAITSELYKKGVSRQIVGEVIVSQESGELDRLKNLIDKKQRLSRYKNDPLKLKQFLVGQGFKYCDIEAALRG